MADNDRQIKIAAVQDTPVFFNIHESTKKVLNYLEKTSTEGAGIVAFPETWLQGYPVWVDSAPDAALWNHEGAKILYRTLFDNALEIGDENFRLIQKKAKETGTFVVIGVHEKVKATLYNTILIFHPDGENFLVHRKLVPTYTERLIWGRGDGSTMETMQTPHGVLGALICWEHWMPLLRAYMHSRAEVIHVAQWPSVNEVHLIASRQYAFEGNTFVIASGAVVSRQDVIDGYKSLGNKVDKGLQLLESISAEPNELLMNGGTCVIGPSAELLTEPLYDKPGIIYAEVDLDKITEKSLTLDTDGHYSRPDVFSLHVNKRPLRNVTTESEND